MKRTLCCFLIFAMLFAVKVSAEPNPVWLLEHNDAQRMASILESVQRQFESGTLSEVELRNTYRPFYDLNETAFDNLKRWVRSTPDSYVGHLALGIYYKRRGADARGGAYMSNVSKENINTMRHYYKKASDELNASLTLTKIPYLSIFHLQTIAQQYGDRAASVTLVEKANKLYPNNFLVRCRHALTLTPRWGGSYEEMESFRAETKASGAPERVVKMIEAIEHNDKGFSLESAKKHKEAMPHFYRALELGADVGGEFTKDFLGNSQYYVCWYDKKYPVCK